MSNDSILFDNSKNYAMKQLTDEAHLVQVENELKLENIAANPLLGDMQMGLQFQEEVREDREFLQSSEDGTESPVGQTSLWVEKYAPRSFSQVYRPFNYIIILIIMSYSC